MVTVRTAAGHGSGFFIDSEGYLLTNEHVVEDASLVRIILRTGRQVVGEVVRSDSRRDVALVRVEETNVPAVTVTFSEPEVGTEIFALGAPRDEELSGSVTKGIVSAYRVQDGLRFIQSDVNVQPGNSGGPIVNEAGQVIGITSKGMLIGGVAAGINYFIPISDALDALGIDISSIAAKSS